MAETAQTSARTSPQTSDVIGTSALAVIGAVAVIMGLGYGFRQPSGGVGPGFLPVMTGGFVVVASLSEIARLYLTAHRGTDAAEESVANEAVEAEQDDASEVDTFGRVESERQSAIVKIFGLLLVALLLVDVVGLLLALAGMVFVVVLWVEKQGWVPALVSSACATLLAYVLFVQLLGVPAPQGMLGLI